MSSDPVEKAREAAATRVSWLLWCSCGNLRAIRKVYPGEHPSLSSPCGECGSTEAEVQEQVDDGGVDRQHLRAVLAALDASRAEAQRLRDLARYHRVSLADEGLITEAEYAALAADHGAVARLEGYDALRAEVATLTRERDEACAEVEALRALLDDIITSLRWATERDDIRDPLYESLVESACGGAGYGALMDAAQRCWRRASIRHGDPPGGEHIAGPCRATVDKWLRLYAELPNPAPPKGHGAEGVVVDIAALSATGGRS